MFNIRSFAMYVVLIAVAITAITAGQALGADAERESKLIAVLKSDAPPQNKAIACKHLAIYGSKTAVPSLAGLLPDKELNSWARIALEAIEDPSADEALRGAMGKLKGRVLIGVINSIGVRRDAKAVEGLVQKLKDADAEVASAAGEALGRIGGDKAASALAQSLTGAPPTVRSSIAYGCILCAERLHAEGKSASAVKLYDQVRKADVPKPRRLEAVRGAILARGSDGVGLLVEQIKSPDKAMFGIALSMTRELSGDGVTEALAGELGGLKAGRRALFILALAARNDPKALPAVLGAVKSGPDNVRVMAMSALEKMGDASCVPVLLDAAVEDDAKISQTARATLARLPRGKVDADIARRLAKVSGEKRRILIGMAGLRRIESAIPTLVRCTEDDDARCRAAAVAAVGAIGGLKQAPDIVKVLQKTRDPKEQAGIDKALRMISTRSGADCAKYLIPLTKSSQSALRVIALNSLVCAGGAEALTAVKSAIDDKDERVRDEAVRTLSKWPNNWPDDSDVRRPLLELAKSGKKPPHRILALRGYLQHLQGAKKLKDTEKLAMLTEALPLAARTEEKHLAVSVLGTIRTGRALEMLVTFTADRATAEEACSAIVNLAGRRDLKNVSKPQRRKALQAVVDKSKSGRTKRRAGQMLKAIK